MNDANTYNLSYLQNHDYMSPPTLVAFVDNTLVNLDLYQCRVLEVGCGSGSLRSSLNFNTQNIFYDAIDISRRAIDNAIENNTAAVNFICEDILIFKANKTYDLIIDSHLFHCLHGEEEILSYLEIVTTLLSTNGYFLVETIVTNSEFLEVSDFRENHLLYDNGTFIRTLFHPMDLENILLKSGLKIKQFVMDSGLKMIQDPVRTSVKVSDPDVVRFVLYKA